MTTRRLGLHGFEIGDIGLGCWQFGGAFGPMTDATAEDIMEMAAGSGGDFFDTANVYGGGRSEELIGRFNRGRDPRVIVATKYGRGPDAYPDKYSEAGLRGAIDASRRRLGVESLDLLQLHCIPPTVLREGKIFAWLGRAVDDGLIKRFGASVETVEEGMICLEQEGLLSLQIIFNLFRQKPAEKLFPRAREQGVGIIVRLPLASGLLSGKFDAGTSFHESDHRNYNCDGQHFNVGETFAGLPFAQGAELAGRLKSLVPAGMTMAQMSLRWILDHDEVSVVIPGASSPQQVGENAAASALAPLPAELHEKLADFYRSEVRPHIRGGY